MSPPLLPADDLEPARNALLDVILPPSADGRMPGAGDLGLAGYLAERAPDLLPAVDQALTRLDELAAARGAGGFLEATRSLRASLVHELDAEQPGLLPGLVFHVDSGYYQHPRVLEGLGLEPRPPFPKGYELEPGDLGGLERVRQRGPIYRIP